MANADFSVDDQVDVDVPPGPDDVMLAQLLEPDDAENPAEIVSNRDFFATVWIAIVAAWTGFFLAGVMKSQSLLADLTEQLGRTPNVKDIENNWFALEGWHADISNSLGLGGGVLLTYFS